MANFVMSDPQVAGRLAGLQSFAFARISQNSRELNLAAFESGEAGIPGQVLVKLRQQGDSFVEDQFLLDYQATLLARLPLPGAGWQEQTILHLRLQHKDLRTIKADARASYVVANTIFAVSSSLSQLGQGRTTTNAARLLQAITRAERRGNTIRTASLAATCNNLAIEDALRRCAHCLEVLPARLTVQFPTPSRNGSSTSLLAFAQAAIFQQHS